MVRDIVRQLRRHLEFYDDGADRDPRARDPRVAVRRPHPDRERLSGVDGARRAREGAAVDRVLAVLDADRRGGIDARNDPGIEDDPPATRRIDAALKLEATGVRVRRIVWPATRAISAPRRRNRPTAPITPERGNAKGISPRLLLPPTAPYQLYYVIGCICGCSAASLSGIPRGPGNRHWRPARGSYVANGGRIVIRRPVVARTRSVQSGRSRDFIGAGRACEQRTRLAQQGGAATRYR